MALRGRWIPGVVATYVAHFWMAAIALIWFFVLGRRFPVGGLDSRQLRPWYLLSLVIVAANAVLAFASPPANVHVNPLTLAAELVALALVVGPCEELLFRGLIQTSLNGSIHAAMRWRGWQLPFGTLFAAVLFGLFHLVNLGFQPLAATMEQVAVGPWARACSTASRTFRVRHCRFFCTPSPTGSPVSTNSGRFS